MISPLFTALWLLCGLGAVVFAASTRLSWYNVAAMVCGFVAVGGGKTPLRLPDPSWLGTLTACVALVMLIKPSWSLLGAFSGGALAGFLAILLSSQSIPRFGAGLIAAMVVLPSLLISSRREDFAPTTVRDIALLGLATGSLLLAVAPEVSAGWRSAAVLNVSEKGALPNAIPQWVVVLGSGAVFFGGLQSYWWRRRS